MCGRFHLSYTPEELLDSFHLDHVIPFESRFNITPRSYSPVIRNTSPGELSFCYWGLIPSWAKDSKFSPINAKAETIREKPFFRAAMRSRRCIIPAHGFYEWQGEKGNKQAYYIHPAEKTCLAFAGLWESWQDNDKTIESFTIITTEANKTMQSIHHRMPVILKQEDISNWLTDGEYDLLRPCEDSALGIRAVGPAVNNPVNDNANLIKANGKIQKQ